MDYGHQCKTWYSKTQRKSWAEHSHISYKNTCLDPASRGMDTETRISKWDLVKLKSFSTAFINKNKKATHRMYKNICKQSNQ